MRPLVPLALLCLAPAAAQEPGFYDESVLRQLRIVFFQKNWREKLVEYYDAGNVDHVHADLLVDGVKYRDVGVQHRGDANYSHGAYWKDPLRVTMDAFVPDQTLMGFDIVTLDNGKLSSPFNEVAALWVHRPHMRAPRANLVHVIAGTADDPKDLGVYTNTERLDKTFFRSRFRDDEGHRYTPNDINAVGPAFNDWGDDPQDYVPWYFPQGGDPATWWMDVRDASVALNDSPVEDAWAAFDAFGSADQATRLWMGCGVCSNIDSVVLGKNYYMYEDVHNGQLVPLPWDLDLALVGYGWNDFFKPTPGRPISRLFAKRHGRQRAIAIARHMLDRELDWAFIGPRLTALVELAKDAMLGSPYEFLNTEAAIDSAVDKIKVSVQTQRATLLVLQEFNRERPVISDVGAAPALPGPGDEVWVSARVTVAATTIEELLLWVRREPGRFLPARMLDDGAHHDGAAGDDVYGAAIPPTPAGALVDWYLEARPDEIKLAQYAFEPQGTEVYPRTYQVRFVAGEPPLRVSELLYSGGDGEYVELTNTGDQPLDLAGWSLDDQSAGPGTFDLTPAGVLAPGQSLLVVETDPDAFRAAWGLSAATVVLGPNTVANLGRDDAVHLFDASGTLIDRLTYGDERFPGTHRAQDASASACERALGQDDAYAWAGAAIGDAQGSWTSVSGDVGSPGVHSPTECGVLRVCGPAVPCSSGLPAWIGAHGDRSANGGALTVRAGQLPQDVFALLLASPALGTPHTVPGSQGRLCLGGAIGRDPRVVPTGFEGTAALELDPAALPGPDGPRAAAAGETWYLQWAFRDANPLPTFNFTDAVALTFE